MTDSKTATFLATMIGIAESVIPTKPKKPLRPKPIKQGNLNKICSGCGHKNKKCSCQKVGDK